DGIRDFHVTGVQTCALPISEAQVRAVAAAQLDDALPVELEEADDVFSHHGRRGRGQAYDRDRLAGGGLQGLPERGDLAVRRPEVVTPLADAVRLVDHERTDGGLLHRPPQLVVEALDLEPLRGEVQQAVPLFPEASKRRLLLRAGVAAADRLHGDHAATPE